MPNSVPTPGSNRSRTVVTAVPPERPYCQRKDIWWYFVAIGVLDGSATTNQEVAGSTPAGRTNLIKNLRVRRFWSSPRCAGAISKK